MNRPAFPVATLTASVDAPIGEALTRHAATSLIGEGLRSIIGERMEQIQKHGHRIEADLAYTPDVLPLAAVSYLNAAIDQLTTTRATGPDIASPDPLTWPNDWPAEAWKPKDVRANLVKAAGLVWAAIDRLDHAPRDAGEFVDLEAAA